MNVRDFIKTAGKRIQTISRIEHGALPHPYHKMKGPDGWNKLVAEYKNHPKWGSKR